MLIVGACRVVLDFYGNNFVEKKQSELKKLIKKVRIKFHVDFAEVDDFTDPEKCTLAFAVVGSEVKKVKKRLQSVTAYIDEISFARVVASEEEFFRHE